MATLTLQQALNFTADDLLANREGRLSEMQEYRLRVRRQRAALIGVALVLAGVFIATLFLFLAQRTSNSILTLVGIGVTLCNAALTGVFARHWMRLNADIRGGTVLMTEGVLERVVKPVSRRVYNYVVRVGEVEIFVSKDTFDAFQHQQPYTLYRAPYTGTLLSAEQQ
jgi:hypothetical protein